MSYLYTPATLDRIDSTLSFILSETSTLAAWIKPASFGESSRGIIFAHGVGNDNNLRIALRMDNQNVVGSNTFAIAAARSAVDGAWRAPGTGVLTLNQWTHVAASYDGSVIGNQPKMYLNGADAGTPVQMSTPSGTRAADNLVNHIGGDTGNARSYDGRLGAVAGWSRILHPSEIWRVYDRGPLTVPRGLSFWYSFGRVSWVEYGSGRGDAIILSGGVTFSLDRLPRPILGVS